MSNNKNFSCDKTPNIITYVDHDMFSATNKDCHFIHYTEDPSFPGCDAVSLGKLFSMFVWIKEQEPSIMLQTTFPVTQRHIP